MDNDLLIPIFWTILFGVIISIGVNRLSRKLPTGKKWVRPDPNDKKEDKKTS